MKSKLFVLSTIVLVHLSVNAQNKVTVDGSSSVYPITEAVSEEFQKAKKGEAVVTVGISGTGGGFKKFCRGEIDVSDASRPILKDEIEICAKAGIKFFEFPVAFDALTVVVSLKNSLSSITVAELKKMWSPESKGAVKKWKDVNPAWPDSPLKLFGPGPQDGTFDYFTEAIMGKAKSSRGDYTASEDDNTIVTGIANDNNALGYVPYSYFAANQKKLKALSIDGGEKAPKKGAIAPSPETVLNATYYPLARPLFIYVNAVSAERKEVKDFVDFYMKNAKKLVQAVKYVPLKDDSYQKNIEHLAKKKIGTVFGGVPEVGITVEEIQRREAK